MTNTAMSYRPRRRTGGGLRIWLRMGQRWDRIPKVRRGKYYELFRAKHP